MYGAAYVRQFPVHERLLHWTVPILALLLGVVANRLAGWLMPRAGRVSTLVPGALILATPALSIVEMPPPYVRDNVAPALTRLAEAAQPGDMLFLNFGMWHSWQRYGSRVPVAFHELIVGGCPKDYPRGYLRELEPLRGNPRVWLLFARVADRPSHEVRMRYLDSIGIRAEELQAPARGTSESSQVDLYRYDFSDSTRLRSASAESFPIPAGLVEVREGCRANVDAMYRRADGTRVVTVF
jgi:hypothetical protein